MIRKERNDVELVDRVDRFCGHVLNLVWRRLRALILNLP
jgi:hypothetical protein